MGSYGGATSYLMCVFSPSLHTNSPLPPSNHPYVITRGTGKKPSKMAGNSAIKPLQSTPNELPCITVEWCGKKLYMHS